MREIPDSSSGPVPGVILSPEQRKIWESLDGRAPSLANQYLGAIRVLTDKDNPARINFAAHAAREIMNRLPDYFDVPKQRSQVAGEYMEQISEAWLAEKARKDFSGAQTADQEIPGTIQSENLLVEGRNFLAIDKAVSEFQSSGSYRDRIYGLYANADPLREQNLQEMDPFVDQWVKLHRKMFNHVHLRNPGTEPPDDSKFSEDWKVMEGALLSLLRPFWEPTGELDDILKEANPATD